MTIRCLTPYRLVALFLAVAPAAAQDDWESERLGDAAGAQLAKLAVAIEDDPTLDGFQSEGLFEEHYDVGPFSFGAVELTARQTWAQGGISVERLRRPDVRDDAESVFDRIFLDPLDAVRNVTMPLSGATAVSVHFKVVGVTIRGALFTTDVLYEASGTVGEGRIQQTGRWRIDWGHLEEVETPLIDTFRVTELDLVRVDRPLFAERTRAVLARAGGVTDLLARGCEYWFGRIDDVGERNFWGHNGIALGDVNGDGLDDLYVATGTGLPNMLFVQNPDGTATERALEAGCAWLDDTKGVLLIDFDNDGDRDLFCAIGPTIVVSTNDGEGRFRPARSLRAATDAAFYSLAAADYDLDGDLDLYAVRYVKTSYGDSVPLPFHDARNGPRNHLLRNDGEAGFTDVTDAVGLGEGNDRFSMVGVWADYDLDGDLDLYVANDFGRNNLFRNDGGMFVDVAAQANAEDQAAGMGVSFADVDLDGDPDLLISNMFSAAGRRVSDQPRFQAGDEVLRAGVRRLSLGNTLLLNRGDGTFEDQSDVSGLRMGRWAWGALFSDFDGDGLPDAVVPNGFVTGRDAHDL